MENEPHDILAIAEYERQRINAIEAEDRERRERAEANARDLARRALPEIDTGFPKPITTKPRWRVC